MGETTGPVEIPRAVGEVRLCLEKKSPPAWASGGRGNRGRAKFVQRNAPGCEAECAPAAASGQLPELVGLALPGYE